MNIVLFEPEIPQNTGNIARTCASTGAALHLIKPLGFSIDDKQLKRAGLDYWHSLNISYHDGFDAFLETEKPENLWFLSTKGVSHYHKVKYSSNDYLVFGKETAGLPAAIREKYCDRLFRVPMVKDNRSLNLSNTVAIVLYEALRQQGFEGMS